MPTFMTSISILCVRDKYVSSFIQETIYGAYVNQIPRER